MRTTGAMPLVITDKNNPCFVNLGKNLSKKKSQSIKGRFIIHGNQNAAAKVPKLVMCSRPRNNLMSLSVSSSTVKMWQRYN